MGSNIAFVGGGAMQCEWCRSNLATYKFSDSNLEKGATKVVCPGCFHILSLSSIRQDLFVIHQKVEAIEKRLDPRASDAATG